MTLHRAFCLFLAVEIGDSAVVREQERNIAVSVDAEGKTSQLWGESTGCDNPQVMEDVGKRCVLPGPNHGTTQQHITCWGCRMLGGDAHPVCTISCCDPSAQITDNECHCTPTGHKYHKGWDDGVIGGNTADKCCGTGHTTDGTCGCSEVGTKPRWGASESDCCSNQWNSDKECVKKSCTKKNEKGGSCCRVSDGDAPMHGENCGCFHANQVPHELDDVDGSNCCSGSLHQSGQKCGCIQDHSKPLPEGANKDDCCSGATEVHDGAEYCRAAECSEVGSTKSNGDFCCSGKDSGGKCACVLSGDAAPEREADCCSGEAKDGKCAFLAKGKKPNLDITDESVCQSGKLDEEGKCSCFRGGSQSKDADQCCSAAHEKGSEKCSCVPASMVLANGAKESDCCSGISGDDGACGCISGHTVPLEVGVSATDCCTGGTEDRDGKRYCRPAYCSRALLSLTNVSVNNLGGQGPDFDETRQTLVFEDVFPDLNRKVNLVISNTSAYVPQRSERNGVKGVFGVLNVKSGKDVGLRFGFVNADTGKVEEVPDFLFSFLDLDTGIKGSGQEYVMVMGYNSYKMAANSIVDDKPIDDNSGYFYGSQHGFGYFNPTDLRNMTPFQTQRLVTFEFSSSSGFDVIVGASEGVGGRNIFFGGASALYCGARKSTTATDTDAPPSQPTVRVKGR